MEQVRHQRARRTGAVLESKPVRSPPRGSAAIDNVACTRNVSVVVVVSDFGCRGYGDDGDSVFICDIPSLPASGGDIVVVVAVDTGSRGCARDDADVVIRDSLRSGPASRWIAVVVDVSRSEHRKLGRTFFVVRITGQPASNFSPSSSHLLKRDESVKGSSSEEAREQVRSIEECV